MTILQRNYSHEASMARVKAYLTGKDGERIVDGCECVQGFDFPSLICCWDKVMDDTRFFAGNDKPWKGKRAVTYRHFVISPDAEDGMSAHDLLMMAREWTLMHFGDLNNRGGLGKFESYICIHDDNDNRIPHAHIIVNNTDLDTKARLHIDDKENTLLWDSLQDISKDWGISYKPKKGEWLEALSRAEDSANNRIEHEVYWRNDPKVEAELQELRKRLWTLKADYRRYEFAKTTYSAAARREKREIDSLVQEIDRLGVKSARTKSGRKLTKIERALMHGHRFSWKQDIANGVKLALDTSRSEEEFVQSMERLGFGVRETPDGSDYVFSHYKNPARWSVKGWSLGNNYKKEELLEQIALNEGLRRLPQESVKERAFADVLELMAEGGIEIAYKDRAVRLEDACKAIRFNRDFDVRCLGDFERLEGARLAKVGGVVSALSPTDRKFLSRLRDARTTCEAGDYFFGIEQRDRPLSDLARPSGPKNEPAPARRNAESSGTESPASAKSRSGRNAGRQRSERSQ